MSIETSFQSASQQHRVEIVNGSSTGEVWQLPIGRLIVGRSSDCGVQIDLPHVSRHHCVFLRDEFTVRVRDLGSRNGTCINGERAQGERLVESGDVITIGELQLRYVLGGPDSVTPRRRTDSAGIREALKDDDTAFVPGTGHAERPLRVLT